MEGHDSNTFQNQTQSNSFNINQKNKYILFSRSNNHMIAEFSTELMKTGNEETLSIANLELYFIDDIL